MILLFTQRALKYRIGRSLRALATSEIASSTLGVRTANWKLLAFVLQRRLSAAWPAVCSPS